MLFIASLLAIAALAKAAPAPMVVVQTNIVEVWETVYVNSNVARQTPIDLKTVIPSSSIIPPTSTSMTPTATPTSIPSSSRTYSTVVAQASFSAEVGSPNSCTKAPGSGTNMVKFVNLDATERTIYFTPNPGSATMKRLIVPGNQNATAYFKDCWCGNYYSISGSAVNVAGMLGEVCWQSWDSKTFFDVSAIVQTGIDNSGVKIMFPENDPSNRSGCEDYTNGCENAYYVWNDDKQTKSTTERIIITTLGGML